MTTANIHFAVTSTGLAMTVLGVLRATYRIARILERFEQYVDKANQIQKDVHERLTWLERKGQ